MDRKFNKDEYVRRSGDCLKKNNDERVKDYEQLLNGEFVVDLGPKAGLDKIIDVENWMLSHLGTFTFSNSKTIVINFVNAVDGFYNNSISIFYQDTDSK